MGTGAVSLRRRLTHARSNDKVPALANALGVSKAELLAEIAVVETEGGEVSAPGDDVSAETSSRMGKSMTAPTSMADLVNDPEVLAASPTHGLARVGGGLVARGYDEDGLMYAVEISFYVRPTARDTRHTLGAEDTDRTTTKAGTSAPRPKARTAQEAA